MAYSGIYKVINRNKYIGNPIIKFRSLWERSYCKYLDNSPDVIAWNYEGIQVPYWDSVRNKKRKYFVDFYVETKNKIFMIEIKPAKSCNKPTKPKTRKGQKAYLREQVLYINNTDKWKAARKFAERNGWEFRVINEYHLGIKKSQKNK